jgi:predicted Zn-dependent protease
VTRDEMLEFVQKVLEKVGVPDAIADLSEDRNAYVRFGQNRLTQNMDTFRRELRLWVGDGSRKVEYVSHRIDLEAIPGIVATAEDLLKSAAPDPEYMPPAETGQVYPAIEAFDEATARAEPGPRMEAAAKAIGSAEKADAEASGIAGMSRSTTALATSTGNLCFHDETHANFLLTVHAGGGSSYRSITSTSWGEVPVVASIDQVVEEALSDRDPMDFPGGEMDVVLEPQAVSDLVPYMLFPMNAKTSDEGITVFAGMEGRKVTGENFTLSSTIGGLVPGQPFDSDGLANADQVWIDRGVLKTMHCDRFWARKTGRPAVSSPQCYNVSGSDGTTADLVAKTSRCLRIRRFWYIRFVDQKSLELTGMTRDGVFLCENGTCRPVKDFRWNWKPLDLFSRIEALGTPVRKGFVSAPPMLIGRVKV